MQRRGTEDCPTLRDFPIFRTVENLELNATLAISIPTAQRACRKSAWVAH